MRSDLNALNRNLKDLSQDASHGGRSQEEEHESSDAQRHEAEDEARTPGGAIGRPARPGGRAGGPDRAEYGMGSGKVTGVSDALKAVQTDLNAVNADLKAGTSLTNDLKTLAADQANSSPPSVPPRPGACSVNSTT